MGHICEHTTYRMVSKIYHIWKRTLLEGIKLCTAKTGVTELAERLS